MKKIIFSLIGFVLICTFIQNNYIPDFKNKKIEIKRGWNLGNYFDSIGEETNWGNPFVTLEFLELVKNQGFDTIRIPITWFPHIKNDVIDSNFLQRVEEVVDMALSLDFNVIINMHHDGNRELNGWLLPIESKESEIKEKYKLYWTQIALYFKEKSTKLIFESMNEFKNDYEEPSEYQVDFHNDLNQMFVDIIRSTNGNNKSRYLLIPTYNADIDHGLKHFQLPVDIIENKLIVSIHYYDPYKFTILNEQTEWGISEEEKQYFSKQVEKIEKKFIEQNIPVIITEFGVVREASDHYKKMYFHNIINVSKNKIPLIIWDNGKFEGDGEKFALFNRSTNEVIEPEILNIFLKD